MVSYQAFPRDPVAAALRLRPDAPLYCFAPSRLRAAYRRFASGFPGEVTYAVKANPSAPVLECLSEAGMRAFDVASPAEMAAVRAVAPRAALHYHNPVRSEDEISEALRHGIASWSVDRPSELDKLRAVPSGSEIAVRLRLPVTGAAYDFGAKFGADPDGAAALLTEARRRGHRVSITFHPGTQCADPAAWRHYVIEAARVARRAGTPIERLNVGGGFAAARGGAQPDLAAIFEGIAEALRDGFGAAPPALVCEPGRAMVGDSHALILRVKALGDGVAVLNDGVYGALGEWRDLPPVAGLRTIGPDGTERLGKPVSRIVFGPTCDSLDRLPAPLALPGDLAEGDWLILDGMGAYAQTLTTGFNGYGARDVVTLAGGGPSGHRRPLR